MTPLALAPRELVEVLAGLLAAAVAGPLAYRLGRRELGARAPAVLAAVTLAAALCILPLQLERIATRSAVRSTRCPQPGAAAGDARASASLLSTLSEQIPSGDTYAIRSASGAVRLCALTWLLPRVAVDDPRRADWLVVDGLVPESTGVALGDVRRVGPSTYLGRVEP
jgi:hypothetical protein